MSIRGFILSLDYHIKKTIKPPNSMAKRVHKIYNQNDSLLLPPSLGELIPANHPVRVVNDILDRFDIGEIESTYKGGGTGSYNPFLVENMFY